MIEDLRQLVTDLVRDEAGRLDAASRDRALRLAVTQYGKDKPCVQVSDLAVGTTDAAHIIDRPPGWVAGTSKVLSIESPLGASPRITVPRYYWHLVQTPDGWVIEIPAGVSMGPQARLIWTKPHELSDTVDTIPEGDREAVAQYAAAVLLDQAASEVAGDRSSLISADAVDHGQASGAYAARARTARQRYHDLLGIDPKRLAPASVSVPATPRATTGRRLLWSR